MAVQKQHLALGQSLDKSSAMFSGHSLSYALIFSVGLHTALIGALCLYSIWPTKPNSSQAQPVELDILLAPATHGSAPQFEEKAKPIENSFKKTVRRRSNKKIKALAKTSQTPKGGSASTAPPHFDLSKANQNLSPELAIFFSKLQSDIQKNKVYPRLARRLHQSGNVVVQFEINQNGQISNVELVKKCPFFQLNKAALDLLLGLRGSYPFPDEIQAEKISVFLPIHYVL